MTKEELQNRIEQVAYDGATDGCNQAVIEREAEKLAQELVKLFAIPDVSDCSEIYCMYDRRDAEIFCAFDNKERADLEREECGAPYQIVTLYHGKRK